MGTVVDRRPVERSRPAELTDAAVVVVDPAKIF